MGDMFMGKAGTQQGGFSFEGGSPVGGVFGSDSPFFGYERSRREDEASVRPDPLTRQSNELRFGQLQDMIDVTGGFRRLYGPDSDRFFQLSPEARAALDRAVAQAQMPGLTPGDWRSQALAATDPSSVIARSQDYLQRIMTPQIEQQYGMMGLGRSGALGESLTRAGAELALPISAQVQAQRFAIEQQMPNVDVALRHAEIARQFAGFQAADIPRQLEVANWTRKAQGLGSAFNLVPYVAGQDSTSVSREYGNIIMDLIGIIAPLAMAALGGGMGAMGAGALGAGNANIGGNAPLGPYTVPPLMTTPPAPVVPNPPYTPGSFGPYPSQLGMYT